MHAIKSQAMQERKVKQGKKGGQDKYRQNCSLIVYPIRRSRRNLLPR